MKNINYFILKQFFQKRLRLIGLFTPAWISEYLYLLYVALISPPWLLVYLLSFLVIIHEPESSDFLPASFQFVASNLLWAEKTDKKLGVTITKVG